MVDGRWSMVACFLVGVLATAACRERATPVERPEPPRIGAVPSRHAAAMPSNSKGRSRDARNDPQATIDHPPPPGHRRTSRPSSFTRASEDKSTIAITGGCREECEDPKNALRNFLRYLLVAQPEDAMRTWRNFVDTTTLLDNGQPVGAEWESMWLKGQFEPRQLGVERWFRQYEERIGGKIDPDTLSDMLEQTLTFHRISSSRVEMTFEVPATPHGRTGPWWTLGWSRRGLEWLVERIEDR